MISTARLPHRSVLVAAVFALELATLAFAYQVALSFECQATEAFAQCRFLRSLVARAIAMLAVGALVVLALPGPFARFAAAAASHGGARAWFAVHAAGVAILFVPLALAADGAPADFFARAVWFWGIGAIAAAAGGVLWLAPAAAWAALLAAGRGVVPAALALAFVVPDLADLALPLWDIEALTFATFAAVAWVLWLTGQVPYTDPEAMTIGLETFAVHIARQCSGVEGLALVLVFSGVHAMLFRATLRQGRFWLVVVPLALVASWSFNVLRIVALVSIGEHLSPEVAVNGFHSYAGWLFFTVLAVAILAVVQRMDWLHRGATVPVAVRFLRDPVAARIVPFVAFMLGGIVAAAFFAPPDLGYPVKVVATGAALAAFLPVLRAEAWRPDAVAVAAGVAVGLAWALTEPPPGAASALLAEALAALPPAALAGWVALRLVGTIALVPVVEELFFRGYVLMRMDRGGPWWRAAAVVLSSLTFAALHGRFAAALLAGIVFAAVMLRRGRLGDAVAAHVAANAVVAAFAAGAGDWSRL